MLIAACDPGVSGALAIRDTAAQRFLAIDAMPIYSRMVGNKARDTVDPYGLVAWFQAWANGGVEALFIEQVGGAPGQGAATAFTFGLGAGMVHAAAIAAGLRLVRVPPQVWKRALGCSSDKKAAVHRATELMPNYRNHWPRPSNAGDQGKAETAMIALYAERLSL